MGGDETLKSCWDKKPSIKQWMAQNNISDYDQLQVYYRQRQLEYLQTNRTPVYWSNQYVMIYT